jgi:hypothetical protein
MRKLEIEDLSIEIEANIETSQIAGNCAATGDDNEDYRIASQIKRDLADGNDWAWCEVTVSAEYKGLTAEESLGCCSYDSEQGFKNSDYYDQMVRECLESIQGQINDICKGLIED